MSTIYCIIIFGILLFALFGRTCFIIYSKQRHKFRKANRVSPVKTMIILGSGGHTAEMLRILKHLSCKHYSPRVYIHARTDAMSIEKVKEFEEDKIDYKTMHIYRSREVQQSYLTSVYTTLCAMLDSFPLLWKESPELILCNGPGTCVPLCLVAFLLHVFYIKKINIIFVESFCRVKTFSLTGKILYYLADRVIVQWPSEMCDQTCISRLIPWEGLLKDIHSYVPVEIEAHIAEITVALKAYCNDDKSFPSPEWVEHSLMLVEACLDKTWEMLNSGYWKDVPIEYRYCYTLCIVLKSVLLELQQNEKTEKIMHERTTLSRKIIEQIDKGILLGAPLPNIPYLLTRIASELNSTAVLLKSAPLKEPFLNFECTCSAILPGFAKVTCYEKPSMESFYRDVFVPKLPAVLKNCIKHWKALERWKDLNYLSKIAGNRTVPIEIGSRYTEEDWTQHLVNFTEFLQNHITKKNEKIGYLAQHQLFEQIPELKDDFMIPEYCNFTENENVEQPDVNAWFGPSGTVSPLHFDPKNNLLCQVFGYKRVILYGPKDSKSLYPYDGRLLSNTAQVDPMNPDLEKWPELVNAKGLMCYLRPGEILYIPPKWWHHVTSLTPSFSVSFWWI